MFNENAADDIAWDAPFRAPRRVEPAAEGPGKAGHWHGEGPGEPPDANGAGDADGGRRTESGGPGASWLTCAGGGSDGAINPVAGRSFNQDKARGDAEEAGGPDDGARETPPAGAEIEAELKTEFKAETGGAEADASEIKTGGPETDAFGIKIGGGEGGPEAGGIAAELEERLREVERRELRLLAVDELRRRELPDWLLELVRLESAEAVTDSAAALERALNRAVDEAVSRRLSGRPPRLAERPRAVVGAGMTEAEAAEFWRQYEIEARG